MKWAKAQGANLFKKTYDSGEYLTLIQIAARYNQVHIIKFLCDSDLTVLSPLLPERAVLARYPKVPFAYKNSPLRTAVRFGNIDAVRVLSHYLAIYARQCEQELNLDDGISYARKLLEVLSAGRWSSEWRATFSASFKVPTAEELQAISDILTLGGGRAAYVTPLLLWMKEKENLGKWLKEGRTDLRDCTKLALDWCFPKP
jgi:hypothetical protein